MIQTHGAHALMYFYSWMEIALFKKRKNLTAHCLNPLHIFEDFICQILAFPLTRTAGLQSHDAVSPDGMKLPLL